MEGGVCVCVFVFVSVCINVCVHSFTFLCSAEPPGEKCDLYCVGQIIRFMYDNYQVLATRSSV